jgi:gluconolactonase
MSFRILATDIQHPEGPDLLPDGRVVFVETWTGLVKTVELETGAVALHAHTGGGPNACCVDSSGDVLVTQNGGQWHVWRSREPVPAGIQRIDRSGKVEHLLTSVDGVKCVAPNDLCFGSDGRLYFTDPGLWFPPESKSGYGPSYVFAVDSDGRGEVIAELADVYPNGIAASCYGVVWGESHTRMIKRRRAGGGIEVLAELPHGHVPDGLKFDEAGRLWITTVAGSTIDILDCGSGAITEVMCPVMPLNCLFVDGGLLVADGGKFDPATQDVPREGRLVLLKTEAKGQPLFRGRI